MHSMDTLTSIKVFRQVVESGSFVAAAERLDLSTAMVSKHVMHVERRLGVRLLSRNSRTLSLTEPGRVYFRALQDHTLWPGANGARARFPQLHTAWHFANHRSELVCPAADGQSARISSTSVANTCR